MWPITIKPNVTFEDFYKYYEQKEKYFNNHFDYPFHNGKPYIIVRKTL